MALDQYALIPLDQLKAYLNISNTTDDTVLENCINQATNAIEAFCDRVFAVRDVVQWDFNVGCSIVLRTTPVNKFYSASTGRTPSMSISLADATSDYISGYVSVDEAQLVVRRVATPHATVTSSYLFSNDPIVSELVTDADSLDGITATLLTDFPSEQLIPVASRDILGKSVTLDAVSESLEWDFNQRTGTIMVPRGECDRIVMTRYNGGSSTIPYAVQDCCTRLAADLYVSRRYDTGLVLADNKAQPDFAKRQELMQSMLAQFKEIR